MITFEDRTDQFDLDAMNSLLDTELASDEALRAAEAGWIDGNEVGEYQYDLYFVGNNREDMWAVLEPIFAAAPVQWSRVELRDGLEDANPVVVAPKVAASPDRSLMQDGNRNHVEFRFSN